MLRVVVRRVPLAVSLARAGPAPSFRATLPRPVAAVRYKTTVSPDVKKQIQEQDELRRDWDAKILSYEELKPKTQQPSPVSCYVKIMMS